MCDLKNFDVEARGVASIAEEWKLQHDEVRSVWVIEELVQRLNSCLKAAQHVYDDFRLGRLAEAGPFAYFVATLRLIVAAGDDIVVVAASVSREGYVVSGVDELNQLLVEVQEIINEDEFAQASHSYEE